MDIKHVPLPAHPTPEDLLLSIDQRLAAMETLSGPSVHITAPEGLAAEAIASRVHDALKPADRYTSGARETTKVPHPDHETDRRAGLLRRAGEIFDKTSATYDGYDLIKAARFMNGETE